MHTLKEYNDFVGTTAECPDTLPYYGLGLVGEAGEVADKIKKLWRNKGITSGKDLTTEQLVELNYELGDVLWYVTAIAKHIGLDLQSVAKNNITKLQDRKTRGVIKSEGDNR